LLCLLTDFYYNITCDSYFKKNYFSRPITCASVCQFRPPSSLYLYSHLIQSSVTSPDVISLLNNITLDNAFCISQHFTEFHSKNSIQIRLHFHRSESGARRFVWKVVNYTFYRTPGRHIFNTIIPKHFILISKFLFPYSVFQKYTTWLNCVFMLPTYVHLLISFNDTFVGVMEWHRVCNCKFRWIHNETFNTQTQKLVVHTKVTSWISFLVR